MHKNYHERRFLFSFVATLKSLKNMSEVYIAWYWLNLDYEQSLVFLGRSSKTPETRKWPRAWLKAGCRPRFSRLATSSLNTRVRVHSPYKIWRKKRDWSQSRLKRERQYWTESNARESVSGSFVLYFYLRKPFFVLCTWTIMKTALR